MALRCAENRVASYRLNGRAPFLSLTLYVHTRVYGGRAGAWVCRQAAGSRHGMVWWSGWGAKRGGGGENEMSKARYLS